jgi:hypothetical protein
MEFGRGKFENCNPEFGITKVDKFAIIVRKCYNRASSDGYSEY